MNLRQLELFSTLNEAELKALEAISHAKQCCAGEVLFFEGDSPRTLYYLTSGIMQTYKSDPKGNTLVLHYLMAPTLVAELAHFEGIPYPATARCESDCVLLGIEYAPFYASFLKNPEIGFKIIQGLCRKLRVLERVINRNQMLDSFSRVCRFLIDHEALLDSLSQRKIAAMLGITPETLSRNLALLRQRGIIVQDSRKIAILERALLLKECEV